MPALRTSGRRAHRRTPALTAARTALIALLRVHSSLIVQPLAVGAVRSYPSANAYAIELRVTEMTAPTSGRATVEIDSVELPTRTPLGYGRASATVTGGSTISAVEAAARGAWRGLAARIPGAAS